MLDLVVDNWRSLLPMPWASIGLALVSVACGATIGWERERREKPAGLRTLMLVCLGAAVFTMIGFEFSSTTGDSGRVAAQIVTGIGFVGAGVILHSGGSVVGITTAATIWVAAAIGITVGAGYAGAGLGVSLLSRMVLTWVYRLESGLLRELPSFSLELVFQSAGGKTRVQIEKTLSDFYADQAPAEFTRQDERTERLQLVVHLSPRQRHELLAHLAALPGIETIRASPVSEKSSRC